VGFDDARSLGGKVPPVKILWLLEKELDQSLSASGRLATIQNLEARNDLVVLAAYRKEKKQFEHIRSKIFYIDTIRIPVLKRLSFLFRQAGFARKYLAINTVDVVLINSTSTYLIKQLLKYREGKNVKVVLDIRTLPVDASTFRKKVNDYLFQKTIQYAAKHCDGITYITEVMFHYCRDKYGLENHSYETWCSGVDPMLFANRNGDLNASGQIMKLLYHGTAAKNRGIENIVKAIAEVRDKLNVSLTIMGEGDGLPGLLALSAELNLADRVAFMKPVDHSKVPEVICRHDLGILPFQNNPGWNTSSPIKLFEYLSCKKPVIVTRIPAHATVLGREEFAFWADESSSASIAGAMKEAYSKQKRWAELGCLGRRFVEEHYSWEIQIGKLEHFLTRLVNEETVR
jgi:glycosyltransferase involved in cell wall biosynthesis